MSTERRQYLLPFRLMRVVKSTNNSRTSIFQQKDSIFQLKDVYIPTRRRLYLFLLRPTRVVESTHNSRTSIFQLKDVCLYLLPFRLMRGVASTKDVYTPTRRRLYLFLLRPTRVVESTDNSRTSIFQQKEVYIPTKRRLYSNSKTSLFAPV